VFQLNQDSQLGRWQQRLPHNRQTCFAGCQAQEQLSTCVPSDAVSGICIATWAISDSEPLLKSSVAVPIYVQDML
jgi:hypothetical protein